MNKPHPAAKKAALRVDYIDRDGGRLPRHNEDWWEGVHNAIQTAIDEETKPLVDALERVHESLVYQMPRDIHAQVDAALAPFEEKPDAQE